MANSPLKVKSSISFFSNQSKVESAVQRATEKALEICGGKAETYAKLICPVRTGNLKNSITHEQSTQEVNTELIGSDVEYAPYVELGHMTSSGSFVSPKPYLKPAVENHKKEYQKIWENELKNIK